MKLLAALATVLMMIASGYIYPEAMTITDISDDIVTAETSTGNLFRFSGAEDYEVGDMVATIMCSQGTDTVEDDAILCVKFAG